MPVRNRGRILSSSAALALLTLAGCATSTPSTTVVHASAEGLTLGASDNAGRALFLYGDQAGVAIAGARSEQRADSIR